MKKIKNFLHEYSLPIISGILIGTSYIPFPPWAIFFCFAPLWAYWLKTKSLKKMIFAGWLVNFILTIIGFFWVTVVAQEHGHLPFPIALIALLLFASFSSYYIPVVAFLWGTLRNNFPNNKGLLLLALPLMTIICERYLVTIFPWNFGYTWLWADLQGFQTADIWGFTGLSAITIAVNLFALLIYLDWKNKKKVLIHGFSMLLILAGVHFLGAYRLNSHSSPDSNIKILAIQANIGNLQKQYAERGLGFRDQILDEYLELTKKALSENPETQFVFWPETAFPQQMGGVYSLRPNPQKLKHFIKQQQINMIIGGYYHNPDTRRASNGLFFFNKDGLTLGKPYRKTHLLAFGEYVPFSETFPIILKWLPSVANFQRGNGPQIKTLDGVRFGPQICYESLYPVFTAKLAQLDAQIIVNVTNDSWYGENSEPYQHLYMTLARAVEARRPLIRITNTGITTVIHADGEIQEKSPLFQKWTGAYTVPFVKNPSKTFFSRNPYFVDWALLALILLFGFLFFKDQRESKNG